MGLLFTALLAALWVAAWRREKSIADELVHWKRVAQRRERYVSNLRKEHQELLQQHSRLHSRIDDSYAAPHKAEQSSAAGTANSSLAAIRSHFDAAPAVIDYVFMWVDSSNAQVQSTMEDAVRRKLIAHKPHFRRVRDDGTFEFALRSVLQKRRLEAIIRNVYIVTSGELPSWLLPWLGEVPSEVQSTLFTDRPLRAPLQPLVDECQGVANRRGWVRPRSLFLYPHRALFPQPSRELPTFNSNAILATLHRLPELSGWCARQTRASVHLKAPYLPLALLRCSDAPLSRGTAAGLSIPTMT